MVGNIIGSLIRCLMIWRVYLHRPIDRPTDRQDQCSTGTLSPCAPCMLRSISGGSSLKGKSCYYMQSSMPTRLPSGAVLLYQSKLGLIERVSLKVQPVETVLFVPLRVAVVLLLPRGEDGVVFLYHSVLSRVMASQ
jgi:hypothetical protein